MNTINKNNKLFWLKMAASLFLVVGLLSSCDEELPGEGSIPDETPPQAAFSYKADEGDYQKINFANLSISATDYLWDLGDGTTSTEANPTVSYPADGNYEVSLTASDRLGATSTVTKTIEIVEPIVTFTPVIENPGYDIEGDDSYRDFWRNSYLGGPIQITSSPIHAGVKAAKLPSAGDRIGYQLITVLPDTDYTVRFYYTMKTSPVGTLRVAVLNGDVTDEALVDSSIISSVILSDQSDANTYVAASVSFNSGASSQVAIYYDNIDVECRIDSFTIE